MVHLCLHGGSLSLVALLLICILRMGWWVDFLARRVLDHPLGTHIGKMAHFSTAETSMASGRVGAESGILHRRTWHLPRGLVVGTLLVRLLKPLLLLSDHAGVLLWLAGMAQLS
jgi:hypothetical protein